jgi:hypothetical protein
MATMKKPAKKMQMGGSADSYTNYKMGGAVKAKNGKSFPDLNKDGKITKADILKGRGVIAKKGMKVSKAQTGKTLSPAPKKKGVMDAIKDLGKYISTGGLATERYNPADGRYPKSKKKMQYGGSAASMKPTSMMKKGGKMTKKCMYGCK